MLPHVLLDVVENLRRSVLLQVVGRRLELVGDLRADLAGLAALLHRLLAQLGCGPVGRAGRLVEALVGLLLRLLPEFRRLLLRLLAVLRRLRLRAVELLVVVVTSAAVATAARAVAHLTLSHRCTSIGSQGRQKRLRCSLPTATLNLRYVGYEWVSSARH